MSLRALFFGDPVELPQEACGEKPKQERVRIRAADTALFSKVLDLVRTDPDGWEQTRGGLGSVQWTHKRTGFRIAALPTYMRRERRRDDYYAGWHSVMRPVPDVLRDEFHAVWWGLASAKSRRDAERADRTIFSAVREARDAA